MFFFGKREASSPARRNMRFWAARLRKAGMAAAVCGVLGGAVYYGWTEKLTGRLGAWAHAEMVELTAESGFIVKDIIIVGRNRIAQADLLDKLGIVKGTPIFDVSIGEMQDRLAGIPWAAKVVVSRRLPDRIIVELTERTPAALWQYQQKISAIDSDGVVLTRDNLDQWADLPLLVGENAPPHAAEILSLLQAEPVVANVLEAAIRVGNRRWDLRLKNGLTIRLPEEGAELALAKVARTQERDNIFAKGLETIDLRVPDTFIVAPAAAATASPPADAQKKKSG